MQLSDLTQNVIEQKLTDKDLLNLTKSTADWCDNEGQDANLEAVEKKLKDLEISYKKVTGKELVKTGKTGDSIFDDIDPDLLE